MPDLIKATFDSTVSVSIIVLYPVFLNRTNSLQSIIPKGPLLNDLKVFKANVSVLVASEANKTSLFKTN